MKPNILFVFSDQQRWDTCGCYGIPPVENLTPNLDRMASEGVRFNHAYTCQPICGPGRAALMTGKYPAEIGCHVNHRMLPLEEKTIAHHMSSAGYEVGYIGKWHLASEGPKNGPNDFGILSVPPERRGGFKDYWLVADVLEHTSHSYDGYMYDSDGNKRVFPENRFRADVTTDWAIEYLENRKNDKPFFLFLSYIEPHHQNDHNHFEGPHGSKDKYKNFIPPGDLVDTAGNWREEYPDYLGCVNSLDYNLGRLRSTLEKLGIDKNTVIIYTSDHGNHFLTRTSKTYKCSCHDGCIRIPMIIYGPGFTGGKVVEELISLIDLPPTVLTTAGITPPSYMRGNAVQRVVNGDTTNWQDDIFLQISIAQCGRAIRTNKWKYSVCALDKTGRDISSDEYTEDCLYDMESDPHEKNNMVTSPSHKEVRAELAERLKRRMAAAGEKVPKILPKT
ncbi:MAG: sulfatase-like hydrolase/transferase [Elusimicrobiota bacterium]